MSAQPNGTFIYDRRTLNRKPLAPEPREVWLERRKQDLLAAIQRHDAAGLEINDAWAEELAQLMGLIK